MATDTEPNSELNHFFSPKPGTTLAPEIQNELESIMRLHSLSAQELFYKWESYSIKMQKPDDETKLDLKTTRDFKRDIHETLERETRGKMAHARGPASERKKMAATPRNTRGGGEMFDMIEGVSPSAQRVPMSNVNGNSVKRKSGNFETPASKVSKNHTTSSPLAASTTPQQGIPFTERANAGKVDETLNDHIPLPDPPIAPFPESRIKLKSNVDNKKFSYKPLGMKLSSASEILDDRIENVLDLIQEHHQLEDGAFGNPTLQSTNEIVAVGRIASESSETKLTPSSILLETSRRMGGGIRVPLKLDGVPGFDFFPGKIVALRGTNVSGEYFQVSEVLEMAPLPPASTSAKDLEDTNDRLLSGDTSRSEAQPLSILISSGPYTADDNLAFEPLQALCDNARECAADALILTGPFLDIEHPQVASGELPSLPASLKINHDTATLTDLFYALVILPLKRLAEAISSINIILVPSVRDVVNDHVSWPQDQFFPKKKELTRDGSLPPLPRQIRFVKNPMMISLNEMLVAISSQDILYQLRQENCVGPNVTAGRGAEGRDMLARLTRHLIEQRHFFPLFPSTGRQSQPKPSPAINASDTDGDRSDKNLPAGSMLDISYMALGELQGARPDILITPSVLTPFAKVIESVVVVNPGTLSKKRGPGTFARFVIGPRKVSDQELKQEAGSDVQMFNNKVYERSRVDVVRI